MTEALTGRVLGLDPGTKRIGVAVSDGLRIAASPLEVLDAASPDLLSRIGALVAEYEVVEVAVGLPTSLSGAEGPSAEAARRLADDVAGATGLPVHLVDERFTSRMAESSMLEAGVRRRDRRANLDKVAASIMLQSFLDRPEDSR